MLIIEMRQAGGGGGGGGSEKNTLFVIRGLTLCVI